jgi:hypothetical protein
MRRQRIGRLARALPILRQSGDADDAFGEIVVGFERRIVERPIGGDAEAGPHPHRRGVQAMGFAGEMQGAAAETDHMLIAARALATLFGNHIAALPAPSAERFPALLERLQRRETLPSRDRHLLGESLLLPGGLVEPIDCRGIVSGTGLEQQHTKPTLRQPPGSGRATGAGADHHHVMFGVAHAGAWSASGKPIGCGGPA